MSRSLGNRWLDLEFADWMGRRYATDRCREYFSRKLGFEVEVLVWFGGRYRAMPR
jgi:hypothetical protein